MSSVAMLDEGILAAYLEANVPRCKTQMSPSLKSITCVRITAVIGCMFYLMEYCDGNVYWNPALGEIDDPSARTAMYDQMAPTGLVGLDLQRLGLPSEEEYIASYCQHMGIDYIDNWNFFLAFSFFRLAAIAQGVAKRATQGNASNASAREVGDMVGPLAGMAFEIVAWADGQVMDKCWRTK